MAAGEVRGAFSMSEPELRLRRGRPSRTTARPDGDGYVITGQKMWLTNGATANLVAVLVPDRPGGPAPRT